MRSPGTWRVAVGVGALTLLAGAETPAQTPNPRQYIEPNPALLERARSLLREVPQRPRR